MKVFIPAAGLGTRLGSLTAYKPKALVEFNGKPMLQLLIENLIEQGFTDFCINIYHFGDLIVEFLKNHDYFGVDICISDERGELLDTGGAVKKIENFFNGSESVLIHNVDVFTDLIFPRLIKQHDSSGALVSLLVKDRLSSRKLLFDNNLMLKGWKNTKTGEFKWVDKPLKHYMEKAFSGIYIASAEFPEKIERSGSFPIVPVWLNLAKNNAVKAVEHNNSLWFDLGTPDKIKAAEDFLLHKKNRN